MTPHALLAGFLLSLALIGSIAPPPAAGDAIDDTIRQGMTEGQIPGVALAVVKNGEVVLTNHTPQKGMENAARLVRAVSPVIDPALIWPAPRRGVAEDDLFFGPRSRPARAPMRPLALCPILLSLSVSLPRRMQ